MSNGELMYTQADLDAARLEAMTEERELCANVIRSAANGCALADNRAYVERFRANLLREIERPNARFQPPRQVGLQDTCCEKEDRDLRGGCRNCGAPCL